MKTYKKIESTKRQNVALQLILPLLILVLIFGNLSRVNNYDISSMDILLLLALILGYFYYFIFVIYKISRKNIVEMETGCLTRDEFSKYLKDDSYVLFFIIENLSELQLKFGFEKADQIVFKMVDNFYQVNENYTIGRITSSDFMIIHDDEQSLNEEGKKIFQRIIRERIEGADIKLSWIVLKSNKNFKSLYQEAQSRIRNDIDLDIENVLAENIKRAIANSDFSLKIQPLKGNEKINYLNYELNCNCPKSISKDAINSILSKYNLEFQYYKNLLESLIENYDFNERIMIKISADFLRNLNFLFYLGEFFVKHQQTKAMVIFEFYEDEIYYDMPRFQEIIKEYQDINISFALNRIGSASAFEYLKKLEFEFAIFDIEFNKNLQNQKYFLIYKSLFELCNTLKVKTVMRFIDDEALYNASSDFHFDYYQGYLFFKEIDLKDAK